MKDQIITLSELIAGMKNSLEKVPRVKNYEKIKETIPQLEEMLNTKGDIEMSVKKLLNVIQ